MEYLVGDVDDPIAHRLGTRAREEWREEQKPKIGRLYERHPGAVVYGTNGGMRVVFRLAQPFPIAAPEDKQRWWGAYGGFVRYVRDVSGLILDPTCKDFCRLYRLRNVRRDKVQVEGPLVGDPHNIEALDVSLFRPPPAKRAPFVAAALRKALEAVRTAENGLRDHALNKEAFALGGLVLGGHLDREELAQALLDAILANGGDEEKDARKIAEGIEAGMRQPREVPGGRGSSTSSGASRAGAPPAAGAAAPEIEETPSPESSVAAEGEEPTGDGRPIIQITADIYGMTSQASDALRGDPMMYQRNARLVTVTTVTRDDAERSRMVQTDDGPRRELVEGTPRIRIVEHPTLKERLSLISDFRKFDARNKKNPWRPARPDGDVVAALHARGEWRGVRTLRGIIETPTLRPDGTILQGEPRYDAATGLLFAPSEKFPTVPEAPTRADARRAYAMLVDLLADFPDEDDERDDKARLIKAGAHKAVLIAHKLTLVGRAAITNSGVPMFVYDANTRGSGKTLKTDIAAIIATGRPMPRMTYPSSDEELEKVLAGYALRGATLLCLDNVTRPLGGGPLDKILTARDLVELRILTTLEIPTLIWSAVTAATGNNVQFQADTARRVLVSRLESLEVRPEARTDFKRPDLLDHVGRNRAAIVVALLTILRAYFVAGRPDMGCDKWGSFERWAALIPPAIVHAGGADPMKARAEADANPEEDSFAAFLGGMLRNLGDEGGSFTAASVREWLYPTDGIRPTDDTARDVREAVELLCGRAPQGAVASTLGLKLRKFRERVFEVGERRLRLVKSGARAGSARWAIEEVGSA